MAAVTSQSRTSTGATPVPITPSGSDTIAAAQFGPNGLSMRVITTGTTTTVAVQDPNTTALGNSATVTGTAMPATGAREFTIPRGAINQSTQVATVTFSGALTGVTYELYKV